MAVFSKFAVSVAVVAVGYEGERCETASALRMNAVVTAITEVSKGIISSSTGSANTNFLAHEQKSDVNNDALKKVFRDGAATPKHENAYEFKEFPITSTLSESKSSTASSAFCRLFTAVANGELRSVSTWVDEALADSTESVRKQMIELLRDHHQAIKEACQKFVDTAGQFDVAIKKHIENGQLTATALRQLREWVEPRQQQSSANVARDAVFKKLKKDEKTGVVSLAGCDFPGGLIILGAIVIPLALLVCVLNCICFWRDRCC